MKKIIPIISFLYILAIANLCFAFNPFFSGSSTVSGGGTTYFFEDHEDWTDFSGFSVIDETPASTMILDATSKVSGTKSIRFDSQGAGSVGGGFAFAQTEFYMSQEIYIDSTGGPPTNGDGITTGGVDPALSGSNGVSFTIFYDTDHYEFNVIYRNDAGTAIYVIGTTGLTGTTISTDTKHTLYLYYKTGTGADGEVWAALDGGAWEKDTGIDLTDRGAALAVIFEEIGQQSGTIAADEWDFYVDNLWAGDYDPEGR